LLTKANDDFTPDELPEGAWGGVYNDKTANES